MSHKWNYFIMCQIWALHLQRLLNNTNEWQPFTTYQTVFSHLIKLIKVVKDKFIEKIVNNFLEHSKASPKFDHPFWNDVTYSDEYVLYADLLPVCDGIYRNTTTVLPSVCNAKRRLRKSLASLVEKLQISLTNGKFISKLFFLAFL